VSEEDTRLNVLAGKILIDFRAEEPLYLQIARQIEQFMKIGELKPGDQLPTVRELATELRINFNTVTRAYHVLDEARLISTQRGRGTYVWDQPSEETSQKIRQEGLEAATMRYIREIVQLGYSAEEVMEILERYLSSWEGGAIPQESIPNL
jgi:GntR family transcriptional regulator